jgi:PhnB protein
VDDAERLIAFLKSAFGAHEVLRVPRTDGTIMHAELQIGDSRIELAQADPKAAHFRSPIPAAIHLYVPDTDATYQRALAAGATSTTAPYDAPYGDRAANIVDPCGNYWFIATWMGQK